MANPELIRGFDLNDTNTEAIPETKITDGYEEEEVLLSKNYNEVLKQLFAATNKNKNDGVWEWEDPTTNDTEYNTASIVSHNGEIFTSLIDNNEVEPTNDLTNWKSISSPNPLDTKLFSIAGGTANALTAVVLSITEYAENSTLRIKATATNTGATTVNLNGLGVKDVVIDNTALSGGEIVPGNEYFFTYSSNGNFELTALRSDIEVATAVEIRTGIDNTKTITPLGYNQTTLGWGQTWQDVTASRSLGVTYTNSTGKPIIVAVQGISNVNQGRLQCDIGLDTNTLNNYARSISPYYSNSLVAFIPDGVSYKFDYPSGGSVYIWKELR